jgi:hypothetical protein
VISDEALKLIGAVLGSSTVTVAVTKWFEYRLQLAKDKREEAREAAKTTKDKVGEATKVSTEITPILYNLLGVYCQGGNVNVVEFHNGGEFYSRRSIQRMTMTFEACIDRGQSRRLDMQNIIMSNDQLNWVDGFVRSPKQPEYYPDVLTLPPCFVRDYYTYYEVRSAYVVGLYDVHDNLIGLLSLTSSDADFLADRPRTGIDTQVQNLQNLLIPPTS